MAMYVFSTAPGIPKPFIIDLTFFPGPLDWVGTAAAMGMASEAFPNQFFKGQD